MKLITLFVVVAALTGNVAGVLPPAERSYKILMLLPVSAKSHWNMFMAIAEVLADRGHKIVMITNHPKVSTHPNIHEIHHELRHMKLPDMFNKGKEMSGGLSAFRDFLPAMFRDLYKLPSVKHLYEKRKEFDLIIVNHMFNEFHRVPCCPQIMYPFVHELPFITIATIAMDHRQSAVLGNVLNPSYAPNSLVGYRCPLSLWQRVKNTVIHSWLPFYWRKWAIVPLLQKEISAQFPDLPPLMDIERNQSLTLMNSHFSITTPVPLLPSQVEVGAIHCRPAKPLPQVL
ncbi:UDP-glucuronosyltransferase 3A1 [Portunus trituberculatus]|uniref:UDP-glucuronosyltransferase 3A1 n=1 Tax=Portunus trituberculatus TaxID=210409 RepID=A0A5B7HX10_PORTR|nr:UDP-glucuronosyltransferase 3A1 [Portunus trituberculatus]